MPIFFILFEISSISMFEDLLNTIKFEITRVLMLVEVKSDQVEDGVTDKKNNEIKTAKSNQPNVPDSSQPKVGRNDVCPCGSGNKYKNCHGSLK